MALVPRWKLFSAFLFICLVWGSSWAVVRVGLDTVTPILAAGLRFALAAILLGVLMAARGLALPRDRVYWALTGFLSLSAITAPFALIYWGQQYVPSGLSSVLFGTFPFWVAILAHAFLQAERLTLLKSAGIFLGFAGIGVVTNAEAALAGATITWGMLAVIAGAFLQAAALVSIRRWGGPYDPILLNVLPAAIGAVLLLTGSFCLEDFRTVHLTVSAIGAVFYLAVFATVLTFVLYYWLAKHVQAVLISFSAFITPIVAVFTGWLVLGEQLTEQMLVGTGIVVVGIAVASSADLFGSSRPQSR